MKLLINTNFNSYWVYGFSDRGLISRYFSIGKILTNAQRDSFSVTPNLHEIIIGCCLGDLHIRRDYTNAYLRFQQGQINELYILHLYDLFKNYCSSGPKITNNKRDPRTGVIYNQIYFIAYSLPCFNYGAIIRYFMRIE